MFGLRLHADELRFTFCLPSHWTTAELTLQREGRTMRFVLMRASEREAIEAAASLNAQLLHPGEPLARLARARAPKSCHVIPLRREPAAPLAPTTHAGSAHLRLRQQAAVLSYMRKGAPPMAATQLGS